MLTKTNVIKKRIAWWLNPWIIGITLMLILISVPMVLWIASYGSTMAVVMFVVTYLSLLVFVLFMVKRSMLEPHLYVDEKEIEKERKKLRIHRQQVRQNFQQTELEVLNRGERTPVLDVWQLDLTLTHRHPYFSKIETTLIDPMSKELHIRIQIGEAQEYDSQVIQTGEKLMADIVSFVKVIATDQYLIELKKFFKIFVLEIYALKEDEHQRDVPFPILSMLLSATVLTQLAYTSNVNLKQLQTLSDLRFAAGSEIVPHRNIESTVARGLK
jgi:hypothetical protein